jgi:hypothetical protein
MTKIFFSNKKKFSIFVFITLILSFFLGFFLRENAAGGGPLDLSHEWKNYLLLKENFFNFLFSEKFYAGRIPIFQFIISFFDFYIHDQRKYVEIVFLFGTAVPVLFFISIHKNFKNIEIDKKLLIAGLIFLSPYFRTSSFWGLQENLSYIFLLISIIFFNNYSKDFFYNFLSLFFSILSFYADQKFIIFPLFYYFLIINNSKFTYERVFATVFCLLCAIPALIILYYWKGPTAYWLNSKFYFNFFNFFNFVQIVTIYTFPLVLIKIIKNNFKIFYHTREKNFFFYSLLVFISYFFLVLFFENINYKAGGGWLQKLFLLFYSKNIIFSYFFYILLTILCFIINYIYLRISNINIFSSLILFYFVLSSSFINPLFQEYYDPLFLIVMIFFINNKDFEKFNYKNIIFINVYYLFFLIISILYYLNYRIY